MRACLRSCEQLSNEMSFFVNVQAAHLKRQPVGLLLFWNVLEMLVNDVQSRGRVGELLGKGELELGEGSISLTSQILLLMGDPLCFIDAANGIIELLVAPSSKLRVGHRLWRAMSSVELQPTLPRHLLIPMWICLVRA